MLWEKEKMLITCIFPFPTMFSKKSCHCVVGLIKCIFLPPPPSAVPIEPERVFLYMYSVDTCIQYIYVIYFFQGQRTTVTQVVPNVTRLLDSLFYPSSFSVGLYTSVV